MPRIWINQPATPSSLSVSRYKRLVEKSQVTNIIYLDMSNAFVRVPHLNILSKVSPFGITDPLPPWISSHLTQWSQAIPIDGVTHKPKPVTCGFIQERIFGPILFFVFIDDTLNSVFHDVLFLFADGIGIVYPIKPSEVSTAVREICADLSALNDW